MGGTMVEDLEYDLGAMSEMVILAHSKGRSGKGSPGRRGTYINPFMKRVNRAAQITQALIDTGQDRKGRKNWKLVAEKLRAEEPGITPDELRKDYHHAMSDIAIAGTVNACLRADREEATIAETMLALYRQVHSLIEDGREEEAYFLAHQIVLPLVRHMPRSVDWRKWTSNVEGYLEEEAKLARTKAKKGKGGTR